MPVWIGLQPIKWSTSPLSKRVYLLEVDYARGGIYMIKIEVPAIEAIVTKKDISNIPDVGGLYFLFNVKNELLYIGKAKSLKKRLTQHFYSWSSDNLVDVSHNISYATYCFCFDPVEREIYETYLINTRKPAWNIEKVFTYKTRRYEEHWYLPEDLEEDRIIKELEFKLLDSKIKALG